MHPSSHGPQAILRKQDIGFFSILLFNWIAETLRLQHLLYGENPNFNWSRVLLRSVFIILVWAGVHLTTRRLVKRLHYLEEFQRVCSWCRKVSHEGKWLTMEEFFGSKFDAKTSHGICPECAAQMQAQTAAKLTPPAA